MKNVLRPISKLLTAAMIASGLSIGVTSCSPRMSGYAGYDSAGGPYYGGTIYTSGPAYGYYEHNRPPKPPKPKKHKKPKPPKPPKQTKKAKKAKKAKHSNPRSDNRY